MAAKPKAPGESLFNSPTLSDVKTKLHCSGKVHEFHAHKSILASGSRFVSNAFTGSFKDASDNMSELHDDNLEHFKVALKFLYTHRYDEDAIVALTGGSKCKYVCFAVGVSVIAENYDIDLLPEYIATDMRILLGNRSSIQIYEAVIKGFYKSCTNAGSPIGKVISKSILDDQTKHMATSVNKCEELMRTFPCFGADITLEASRRRTILAHMDNCLLSYRLAILYQ